jgi:hypothetical protein
MPTPQLNSDLARGTFGKAWIYSTNRYQTYAKAYTYPPTTPNPNPEGWQLIVKTLSALWQALTIPAQQTWLPKARRIRLTPFAFFMQTNLRRARGALPPLTEPE